MQLTALLIDSLRESMDRKIFWVMIGITLLIVAAMACIGIEDGRVSLAFGLWEMDTTQFDPATETGRAALLGVVVYLLMDSFLGWIGVILMIIATAGVFPAMMESGTVNLLLAKPISRSRLFLYKYLSSMVFVLIQATVFVGLTFLVMGLRWNVWAPRYFVAIPLLVLLFSFVYCVTVLVAVKTQSAVTAILLGLGAWLLFATPILALQSFEEFPALKKNRQLYRAVYLASWIPPKTSDIVYIAARWTRAGTSLNVMPEPAVPESRAAAPEDLPTARTAPTREYDRRERARRAEEQRLRKNPALSIGSSLLFEAIIVLWAMWIFSRRDF